MSERGEINILLIFMINIVLILTSFAGCLESGSSPPKDEQVKNAFIKHFNYLLDGDAESFISGYYEHFVDLDTGEPVNFAEWSYEVRSLFNNQEVMNQLGGKTINDLFEMDYLEIWDAQQVRDDGEFDTELTKFTLKAGDFLVFVSPNESGPFLPYGHHAYYRKIDGVWKIVAFESCAGGDWALIT
jgi:hypothetical protein